MKKVFRSLIITFIVLFSAITTVFAGSVSMSFAGNSTVVKGNNITLTISVGNVTGASDGKVYGVGGYVNYDAEYLQYVSYANLNGWAGNSVDKGTGKRKFVTYDMGTGGVSSGGVATMTFKAIKAGTTTVTFSEPDVSDKASNTLDASVSPKTITITEPEPAKDSDSKLKSLSVEGYSISPSFNSSTKSYSVTVPEGTSSVTINAAANSSKAQGVSGTGTKTLTGDTSTFTVTCTAENGSTTSYTVTVNRQKKSDPTPTPTPTPEPAKKSSDSSLKYLSVSGYTLSPSFRSGTTEYSMTVGNGITGLYVQATPNDPKATYVISGDDHWDVGRNTINITVTAEDGSKTTYKVYVTRESAKVKSSDKNVDFRINNPHTITPAFSNSVNNYDVVVPYDVKKLDLTVVPFDKNASVKIIGNEKFSSEEKNVVKIIVTAEDGSTKTITLNVTRSPYKANTDLLDLKVKDHKMTPDFKPSKTKYKVTVPNRVKQVKVLVKAPKGAKYKITGYKNLQEGKNIVLVKVTDQKGFVKYYEIDVYRKQGFKRFIPFLIILLLLLLLLLLLWLLHRRRKNKQRKLKAIALKEKNEDNDNNDSMKQNSPVNIEFKPEFNFGSKNGTDDDVIYSKGDMINGTDVQKLPEPKDGKVIDAEYDPYDDVVTKDELVDALNEGIRTKNVDKLQMLLDQENLNRKKDKIKKKEKNVKEDNVDDEDYEPHHSKDDYEEDE